MRSKWLGSHHLVAVLAVSAGLFVVQAGPLAAPAAAFNCSAYASQPGTVSTAGVTTVEGSAGINCSASGTSFGHVGVIGRTAGAVSFGCTEQTGCGGTAIAPGCVDSTYRTTVSAQFTSYTLSVISGDPSVGTDSADASKTIECPQGGLIYIPPAPQPPPLP